MEAFIKKVQESTPQTSFTKILSHYKEVYNTFTNTKKSISSILPKSIGIIGSLILDTASIFIGNDDQKYESSEVFGDYLLMAFSEKNIILCIDNFSQCNHNMSDFLFSVFNNIREKSLCHIVIITENEDIDVDKINYIQRSIPISYIEMKGFDEHIYFYEILQPIFYLDDFSDNDIKYIHLKCKGEPERLSKLISILLEKDGIEFNHNIDKAIIKKDKLFEVLNTEYIRFRKSDFSFSQLIILFSFISLFDRVRIDILRDLVIYLSSRIELISNFAEDLFYRELQNLIEKNFIDSDGENVFIKNNTDYIDYYDIFSREKIFMLFSKNVYGFLIQNPHLSDNKDLVLRHMYNGKVNGWEEYAYDFGFELYSQRKFFEAEKVFSLFYDVLSDINDERKLVMALNNFEAGDFIKADIIFADIQLEKLQSNEFKSKYLYFYGKNIYNLNGNINIAIEMVTKALDFVKYDSEISARIKNTLQMYWWETQGGFDRAKEYFEDVKDNYKTKFPNAWASTIRGCHNYIFDEERAITLLTEAISCTDDELECAFIRTTMGYVRFRAGNIWAAEKLFEKSYSEISKIKRYESAYAANDLAVCYMLKDDVNMYKSALRILERSIYWNKTNYGRLVLQTHLMICNHFLGNKINTLYWANELRKYLVEKKPTDPVIIRKINMNLGLVYKAYNNTDEFEWCRQNLQNFTKGTSSEYRYRVIFDKSIEQPSSNAYFGCCSFEPWIIVYSHD